MPDRNTMVLGAVAAAALVAGGAYFLSRKPGTPGGSTPGGGGKPDLPPPLGGTPPKLSAPTNVTVRGISSTAVRVSWSPVSGATKYNLMHPAWQDQPEGSVGETSGTSIDIHGLAPNSPYSVWVQAGNNATFGLWGPRSALTRGSTLP